MSNDMFYEPDIFRTGEIQTSRSASLVAHAARVLPTGVASAARGSARPVPLVIEWAAGARMRDADGNDFIDYIMGFGPLLLGHSPAPIDAAITKQLARGFLYGSAHRGEAALAEALAQVMPAGERVLLSNTGSEAVHVALRLARAASGRRIVLKFEGHYHGWLDAMSYAAADTAHPLRGQRPTTLGLPASNPDTVILPWNDFDALVQAFQQFSDQIAAVILEPIPQMGAIAPIPGYLEAVREMTRSQGAALIFDEVVTGFRMGLSGMHGHLGISPDLVVLGKALGAGMPISAVIGRATYFEEVAKGRAPHMGTFNGHGLAVAAALAALDAYAADGFYPALHGRTARLATAMAAASASNALKLRIVHAGGLISIVGAAPDSPVATFADIAGHDVTLVSALAEALVHEGVTIQARGVLMVSSAHDDAIIDETIERFGRACACVAARGKAAGA